MTRVCLDTSAYSHFMRNETAVVDLVSQARDVGLPAVVLGELRTGFRLGRRETENESILQRFLANPVVSVLQVDDEATVHYADIMVDLRRRGQPLPTNDVWIAALAARDGYSVLTYDVHFRFITRVGSHIF